MHARVSILARQFRDEHGLERVHGTADVPVAHLLVEDQAEAVAPLAILPCRGERVELGLDAVLLRAELESGGQREHTDAMAVEGIVGHVLRVVGQGLALVRTVQWRAVEIVAWWGDGGSTRLVSKL